MDSYDRRYTSTKSKLNSMLNKVEASRLNITAGIKSIDTRLRTARINEIKRHNEAVEEMVGREFEQVPKMKRAKEFITHINAKGKPVNGIDFFVTNDTSSRTPVALNASRRSLHVDIDSKTPTQDYKNIIEEQGCELIKEKKVPYRFTKWDDTPGEHYYTFLRFKDTYNNTFDVIKAEGLIDTYQKTKMGEETQLPSYLGFLEAVNDKINTKRFFDKPYEEVMVNCASGYSRSPLAASVLMNAQAPDKWASIRDVQEGIKPRHWAVFGEGFKSGLQVDYSTEGSLQSIVQLVDSKKGARCSQFQKGEERLNATLFANYNNTHQYQQAFTEHNQFLQKYKNKPFETRLGAYNKLNGKHSSNFKVLNRVSKGLFLYFCKN